MEKYFNVYLEFDKNKVDEIIEQTIKSNDKGYVCSVEANVITVANKDKEFNKIVNNALVNICDGSSIALLISILHKKKLDTYVGADLFIKYIKEKKYKFYFLGNTPQTLNGLKKEMNKLNPSINEMKFITLPFKQVNEFNYFEIAKSINEDKPDIIWVSLGAPKQEEFMFNLIPYIDRGVMFGFGAIFDFYSGVSKVSRAPKVFLVLKLEWLYRLYKEPKKQISRIKNYLKLIPKMVKSELILLKSRERK